MQRQLHQHRLLGLAALPCAFTEAAGGVPQLFDTTLHFQLEPTCNTTATSAAAAGLAPTVPRPRLASPVVQEMWHELPGQPESGASSAGSGTFNATDAGTTPGPPASPTLWPGGGGSDPAFSSLSDATPTTAGTPSVGPVSPLYSPCSSLSSLPGATPTTVGTFPVGPTSPLDFTGSEPGSLDGIVDLLQGATPRSPPENDFISVSSSSSGATPPSSDGMSSPAAASPPFYPFVANSDGGSSVSGTPIQCPASALTDVGSPAQQPIPCANLGCRSAANISILLSELNVAACSISCYSQCGRAPAPSDVAQAQAQHHGCDDGLSALPLPGSLLVGQMASVLDSSAAGSGRHLSGIIVQSRSGGLGLDMMVDSACTKHPSRDAGDFRIVNASDFLFCPISTENALLAISDYAAEGSSSAARRDLNGMRGWS